MRRGLNLLATLAIVCSSASAAEKGQFCWPMHFAGVVLGVSQEPHVQRLLGQGFLRSEPPDRTRIYIDSKRTATLRVTMVTDTIVGEVSIANGIDSAIPSADLTRASSKFFDPLEGFGNWHALKLGSTKAEVLKNLGEPKERKTPDDWVYESRCVEDLPQFFTLHFRNGRISKVVFSAPPG